MDELHDCMLILLSVHYGSSAVVVFDGYEEGPSIKDVTHHYKTAQYSSTCHLHC